MQAQPTFEKSIQYDRTTKDYAAYLDGQLIGFYSSHHAAEVALDQVAFERLTHGDCATAAELDGGSEDDPEAVNWNSATASTEEYPICESCQTREFPPSCILPGSCVSCANARYWGFASRVEAAQFAVTRQSLAIEARLTVCGNCQGIHHIQHCPGLRARLVAEPLYAPRELAKLWWKDRGAFIARLASMTSVQLIRQVEAHLAYLQSHRASVITFDHLLRVWMQMIAVADRDGRGPAAPALRLVA